MARLLAASVFVAAFVATLPASSAGPAAKPKTAKPGAKHTATARARRPIAASRMWHTKAPGEAAPVDAQGRPLLVLRSLNLRESTALTPRAASGGFDAENADRAAHALREPSSGNEHPVDQRLLETLYRIQLRFDAPEIRVVSGYRTPRGKSRSNHGKGRAIDIVVPGASDEDVATFAREQGFSGVGIYPVSGFVHVDVRDRSFFWVDASGPGRRGRVRGILADLARRSDLEAQKRGERPAPPFWVGSDVEALAAWAQPTATPQDDEAADTEGDEDEPSD